MSFDNSRFTFNPWNDYFGVVMQQGRVQLDSDWNEWLAEFARRIQAGTMDIVGLAGVPSTTPYAFKINAFQFSGTPHITFGAGRIYVDGLLAENHGPAASPQWDSALAEWSQAPPGATEVDVDYTQQPYYPNAPLLGTPPLGNGPFLVYLDVWQRDVSYLEDPNLVDQAVGVDTTGRLQTVWQVKVLPVSSGVYCSTQDSAIAPWASLIQPSPSLLTTGLVPSASSGPCSLSPASGYTGLENQLYRVQIHQPGAAATTPVLPPGSGTATFKWSRENASVATAVTAIASVTNSQNNPASQLTVQSMGRDQVLGFTPGNWIEITDDAQELNAQGGELHQIDSINSAANTIILDSVLTKFSNGQPDPDSHTRIQRWDQGGTVYEGDNATVWVDLDTAGSTGDIPVPPSGTALILENGITVNFDLNPSGNSFQTGDFWTFAARTADNSVETLTQAPPRGIDHHYCRLGIVDFTALPPTDCRQVFLPLANSCIHVTGILRVASGIPLTNDDTVSIQQDLAKGIQVSCDLPVDPAIITQTTQPNTQFNCPVCFVTVDLPVQGTPAATGFNPLIISANVSVGTPPSTTITWAPTSAAQTALVNQISPGGPPLLARLTLKGNCIWALGNQNVYLNGNAVGMRIGTAAAPQTGLQLPSGDGRRSSDFEMWFWLTSQPLVTLSATSLAFIPQLVNTPSAPVTVTLTNNGTTALTVGPIVPGGANAGDFTVTNTCATPVPAGGNCTITVTFTPAATLTRTGQISITESADSSPLTITLTGIGIQPQIIASTGGLTFSDQPMGTTSAAQTIDLANLGDSQLIISNITIQSSTGAAADFSQTHTCGILQPSQTCAILVQFTPTAGGTLNAELAITHNAPGSPLLIGLTGTGIAQTPAVTASTISLNFGSVNITASGPTLPVTLTSTGNAAVTFGGVTIIGAGADSYAVTSNTCGSLEPGQQCTIVVQFNPQTATSLNAQLQIVSNGSPLTIQLTGAGVGQAAVSSSPATPFSFIPTNVGTPSAAQTVTLTSDGTAPLTISSIAIVGTDPDSFSVAGNTCVNETLQPGQQCTINVQFNPQTAASLTAQLQITSNATGSPLSIPLTGTGQAPGVSANPTGVAFGTIIVGGIAARTLTLTSIGTAPLIIGSATIIGTEAGSFSVTSNLCSGASLQSNQTCTIGLQFKPLIEGTLISAQLQISHNATGSPLLIELSGRGTKLKDTKEKEISEKDALIEKAVLEQVEARPAGKPASTTDTPAETGGEGAMRRAFISPEERPPVGKQALATPNDEPPKDGPKQE